MKISEAVFWRDLLRGAKPLTRAQRNELALIIDDLFVHPMAGRPNKTALERINRDFSTGVMHELVQDQITQGKSRPAAAASVARQISRNLKAHGKKLLTTGALLKRIERWQRQRQ